MMESDWGIQLEAADPAVLSHFLPFAQNTWTRHRSSATGRDVTASDAVQRGAGKAGGLGLPSAQGRTHPKQKEIFPECSEPGRRTSVQEETKPRERWWGPGPPRGAETCNYTSEWKRLWHKTEPHEKEDRVSAAFVPTWVLGSCTFCKETVKINVQAEQPGLSQDIPTGHNRSS